MKIASRLIGTPGTGKAKMTNSRASLSLARCPTLSRPPRHLFGPGKAFRVLCPSDPRCAPRVKPDAHRGPRSPALECW